MGTDEKESELQERILESPSLLSGFDGPAAAAKEVPVRRAGSADVVVVNANDQIVIVECKRATNPECRRTSLRSAADDEGLLHIVNGSNGVVADKPGPRRRPATLPRWTLDQALEARLRESHRGER